MISDIRLNEMCFSDNNDLEISTFNQEWDNVSIQELKDMKIFYSSDSVYAVQLNDDNSRFRIGVEDDGTLFFSKWMGNPYWIPSLIKNLQKAHEEILKQKLNNDDRTRY